MSRRIGAKKGQKSKGSNEGIATAVEWLVKFEEKFAEDIGHLSLLREGLLRDGEADISAFAHYCFQATRRLEAGQLLLEKLAEQLLSIHGSAETLEEFAQRPDSLPFPQAVIDEVLKWPKTKGNIVETVKQGSAKTKRTVSRKRVLRKGRSG